MIYKNVCEGVFLSRPNRFIARVLVNGAEEICHVKNTGRCRELLVPGAAVFLERSDSPSRKTRFSVIAVQKGDLLINMDSQAPNQVVKEWIESGKFLPGVTLLRPECRFRSSRFDFYLEAEGKKHFIEVKGVTLEQEGVVSFPDAPTQRGCRHLKELTEAVKEGYCCHVLFAVQMQRARCFVPNAENDPEFAEALRYAREHGVEVQVLTCDVTPDSIQIHGPIESVQL